MTLPSALLDAIVAGLASALVPITPSAETPLVFVRAIDDLAEDVTEYTTAAMPAVLLTCAALPLDDTITDPCVGLASIFARCYARLPVVASSGQPLSSRGDVAMNLAATVSALVRDQLWPDEDGAATAFRAAQRIQARNRGSLDLAKRGLSLWVVSWQQQLEITQADQDATLHAFRTLHVTEAMGGADTSDVFVTLALEGREPP